MAGSRLVKRGAGSLGGGGSSVPRSSTGLTIVDIDYFTLTAGSITVNTGAAWEELATETGGPGTGLMDLTLTAISGDIVEVGASGLWSTENVNGYLDIATIVSNSPVNYIGGDGDATDRGITAWDGDQNVSASPAKSFGGSVFKALVSGDISSSTVKLRPMVRTSTATNKTFFATADIRFHWWAKVYRVLA